jgi:tubulysin polyketide synthase-like protein
MTATTLLADLYRRGASVRINGDRLGVRAPDGVLTPDVRSAIVARKPELLQVVPLAETYRKALCDGFNLLLQPDGPSDEDHARFLDEQARFTDELGPVLAAAIFLTTGREWRTQVHRCPWCDAEDVCHEPGGRTGH